MSKIRYYAFAVMLISGCASNPVAVPNPYNSESAGVGVALKVNLSGMITYRADTIYFVRGCPDAEENCGSQFVRSNYAKDGRIYLLNAEPGEYMAVAAAVDINVLGDHSVYFVYFPGTLAEKTKIKVRPGRLENAGNYVVSAAYGVCPENAEADQLKHAEMMAPGVPKCGFWNILAYQLATSNYIFIAGKAYTAGTQIFHYRGTGFEELQNAGDPLEFYRNANSDLSGAGWNVNE